GSWEIEAGEEFGDLWQIVEFAPAALDELDAPVQANEEKKRALEIGDVVEDGGVEVVEAVEKSLHFSVPEPRFKDGTWGTQGKGERQYITRAGHFAAQCKQAPPTVDWDSRSGFHAEAAFEAGLQNQARVAQC